MAYQQSIDENSKKPSFTPSEESERQSSKNEGGGGGGGGEFTKFRPNPINREMLILKENPSRGKTRQQRNLMMTKYGKFDGFGLVKAKTIYPTENEEQELKKEVHITFRQMLDKFLSTKKRRQLIQTLVSCLSLASFLVYVLCTYVNSLYLYLNYIDMGVCFLYLIDYLINFILAHHRLNFLISSESVIDLITTIPPFFFPLCKNWDGDSLFSFINITRVLRVMRFFKIFSIYKSGENDVNKQIMMIINTLIMMILICSGIIQIVEKGEVDAMLSVTQEKMVYEILKMRTMFHHYIYFIVVTISTVGYGDIYPYTILGKMIVMCLVLVTLVLIPNQTNDLVQLISAQSEYARKNYKASQDVTHIILTGDISLDSLKSFCQELFHPDHGSQYRHAVIVNSLLPSKEMELFLNEKGNENFLFYLQGDPMNEKDLMRADIAKAKACIIFNNKNSQDPHSSDHQSLLLGLYLKKFVYNYNLDHINANSSPNDAQTVFNPNFRLCMQLIKPESKYHYFNALQNIYKRRMPPDQLVIIEAIKMNILSKSCITPGIMALITNLVMSSSIPSNENEAEWLKEYAEGRGHEIYRISLGEAYKQMTFLEVVANIYAQAQAITFALEIEFPGSSIVKLNPAVNVTIQDIIARARDCERDKDGSKDKGGNSLSDRNEGSLNEREKAINPSDAKIRVFAYLICSDKTVADQIASKDKDKDKKSISSAPAQSMAQAIQGGQKYKERVTSFNINCNSVASQIMSDGYSEDSSESEHSIISGIDDLDFCHEDYFINTQNDPYTKSNIDIMHHTIKDREDISNHIIICGLHPALIHFIMPLRAKYLGDDNLKYIVILAPSLPQNLYDAFTKFPKIIFIQGSPLLPENLFRANITNADKAVILSSGESKVLKTMNTNVNANQIPNELVNSEDQMLDAETIFIYKAIKKCNKNIQIMTELIATSNIEYLLNKNYLHKLFTHDALPQYEFTPVFASGEVFTPSIIDRITCQSYYNPHILTILEQLLNGNMRLSKREKKYEDKLKIPVSNLYLVRVPEAYVNEGFGDLFKYLTSSHHVIAIALYRRNLTEGFYYVYTNPKKSTLLRDCDLVFVLGNETSILELIEERVAGNEAFDRINMNDIGQEGTDRHLDSTDSLIEDYIPNAGLRIKDEKIGSSKLLNLIGKKGNEKGGEKSRENKSMTLMEEKNRGGNNDGEDGNRGTFKRKESGANSTSSKHTPVSFVLQKRSLITENSEKKQESSKYIDIDNLQKRIDTIKKELVQIKKVYEDLPEEIEEMVDQEIETELMMYLTKN